MIYYVILILVIAGLCGVVWVLAKDKSEIKKEIVLMEKEKDDYAELGRGLAEYNQKLQEKKQETKSKILELFRQSVNGKIDNKKVSGVLNFSMATTRRYLDELENEGKIKQVGKTGKNVIYALI